MKQNKLIKVVLLLVFVVIIILVVNIVKGINKKKSISNSKIDIIEKYNYSLKENESVYYKKLFNDLKNELNKKEINYAEYASIISRMFLTDFYTLDNKINKNDIGGVEFIYSDYQDIFIKKAKDTIYKYLENNINRKQKLPIVNEVKITNIEIKNYGVNNLNFDNAYYLTCQIIYEKDLGYPINVNLILVENNNKLEIISME